MARELLLLESSDWQFLITTWSARDYAENRIGLHYENFNGLYNMANKYASGQNVDEGEWHFLGTIEAVDDIFEALDLAPFAKKNNFYHVFVASFKFDSTFVSKDLLDRNL